MHRSFGSGVVTIFGKMKRGVMSFEKENNHFVCDHGDLDAAHFFPFFSKWNTDNRAQYNLCREGGKCYLSGIYRGTDTACPQLYEKNGAYCFIFLSWYSIICVF